MWHEKHVFVCGYYGIFRMGRRQEKGQVCK